MLGHAFAPLPPGAGPIGLLSGDEFTPAVAAFDRALLALTGPRVQVITAADPANAPLTIARAEEHLQVALTDEEPDLIYLAGGDPGVLLRTLDPAQRGALVERWKAGAGVAGASAGAMALCEHCLVPEPGADKPTVWARGLGLIADLGLAVHATTRSADWLRAVAASSRSPVLAIDDATGVLVHGADEPVVIGPGRAWIVK